MRQVVLGYLAACPSLVLLKSVNLAVINFTVLDCDSCFEASLRLLKRVEHHFRTPQYLGARPDTYLGKTRTPPVCQVPSVEELKSIDIHLPN